MGHPNVAQNLLTPNFPRVSKQTGNPTSVSDFTAVGTADRFPPGIHATNSTAQSDRPSSRSPGRLVALLMTIASLPSVVFGTLLWLGLVKVDFPTILTLADSAGSAVRSASVAGGPLRLQDQSNPSIVSPQVLGVPDVVEAKAGEDTPLTLALGGTARLPAGSFLSIRGLPSGTTLSAGRPYDDEEWSLTLEEVDGLKVALPETAQGETQLGIDLLSRGGEKIASAEMLLRAIPGQRSGAKSANHAEEDASRLGANEGVRPFVRHGPDDLGYDLALTAHRSTVAPSSLSDASGNDSSEGPLANSQDDDPNGWVVLSAFVNLREGPSSSERTLGILDKGKKLRVVRRQRNWLEVTDSESTLRGWIYARYTYSAMRSRQAMRKPGPSRLSSPTSEQMPKPAFWTRLGSWITSRKVFLRDGAGVFRPVLLDLSCGLLDPRDGDLL